ncbi:MAG: hypothetical protein A2Z24_00400 [Candidatus Woykebacteria bacterium RBG_16_44_10]|uniref:DUF7670 domain-containing protein n=1 Tax=Candidatus Woykebacteria bacterium RBG_16_44_10 TaxID=1802597 RepID=A0A1G1WFH3_9BACT|nr:MAG: hypothetical protein A2Z24_00400 [Candidatus Woykebacteria bacterium RBG_16_44_10]
MSKVSGKQFKIAGLILLLIPIALILPLAVGETVGGDLVGGLTHLLQIALLVVVTIFTWKKPDLGGKILVGITILLAIIYLVVMVNRATDGAVMGTGEIIIPMLPLFGLPIVSGLLFITSARKGS